MHSAHWALNKSKPQLRRRDKKTRLVARDKTIQLRTQQRETIKEQNTIVYHHECLTLDVKYV